MRHRPGALPACAAAIALTAAGAAPVVASDTAGTDVAVEITGLRSARGLVRACLTSHKQGFPKCAEANGDVSASAPASTQSVVFHFNGIRPGTYAIAVVHDENSNGRIDRALLLMPKEGFGFSRDAPVRMGPPRFEAAAFQVGNHPVHQAIRMRYML